MGSSKGNENANLKYIKKVVSEVMGEDLWNGFYDVVTSERPRIDMFDSGSTLVVEAEAPGIINPADLNITISSNRLNIKGITRDKYQHNKPGKTLRTECLYGAFNRSIELPYPVDDRTMKAVYENGMLEITMQAINDNEAEKTIKVDFIK
jgi:HSP20 family protein